MNSKARVSGGCYCGATQFEILLPVKGVVNCHCNMCRQLSGADYTTWVSISEKQFYITQGGDDLTEFGVSENVSQYFCSICGTRLVTTDKRYPGIFGILRGVIHDDLPNRPSADYFVSNKAAWIKLCSGLPRFGGETGFEPLEDDEEF